SQTKVIIKKFLKWIGFVAVITIVLGALVTLIVFYYPQIIGYTPISSRIVKTITPEGYNTKWEKIALNVSASSFFEKNATIDFSHFCFFDQKNVFELCFEKIHIPISINFYSTQIDSLAIGEAQALGGKLFYRAESGIGIGKIGDAKIEKQAALPISQTLQEIESFLGKVTINSIKVIFDKFEIVSSEGSYKGQLAINLQKPQGQTLRVKIKGIRWSGPMLSGNKNALNLTLQSTSPEGKFFPLLVVLEAAMSIKEQKLQAQAKVSIDQSTLRGSLKIENNNLTLRECELSYNYYDLKELISSDGEIKLDCKMRAKSPSSLIPIIDGEFSLETRLRSTPTLLDGSLKVRVFPFSNNFVRGGGFLNAKFQGSLDEFIKGEGVSGSMNFNLVLQDFKLFHNILKEQKILIPAPLHALHGPVDIDFQGNTTSQQNFFSMFFVVKSDLKSTNQIFKSSLQGELRINKNDPSEFIPELNMHLFLSDVRLILPSVVPREISRIFPDHRIVLNKKTTSAPEKQSNLKINLKVSTTHPGAIKLITGFSKKNGFIPITMDLTVLDNNLVAGHIYIDSFDIDLLRKDAQLAFFNVGLRPSISNSPIEGKILVRYIDYIITINVVGTIAKPQIFFDSRPPLDQDNIMAVLLFGKPLDDVTEEEGESITNARMAAAGKAISLASLYFLSATPVESISYNPKTKQMSAKIKLGSKTSLTLGTGVGEEKGSIDSIGVRKRLGSNFILNSELQTDRTNSETSILTYLEWYNRY
ncbi:MAG: translocation/assembly module TamB domain-containing protein, partial [Oligoflexia bacterium]|nr:translocation/assembly module TamB domain-containing protein [Oligoflexia bacterium]